MYHLNYLNTMVLIFYFFSVFMILNLNISLSKSNFNLYELSVFFFLSDYYNAFSNRIHDQVSRIY